MNAFIDTFYLGINLGSAGFAVVAGYHWWFSAEAAKRGESAESLERNRKAAMAASLAALAQAAVAARAAIESIFPGWWP